MKLFQIPLEPAYPMAFQAVSEPPSASPKWQSFGCNKFRDVQLLFGITAYSTTGNQSYLLHTRAIALNILYFNTLTSLFLKRHHTMTIPLLSLCKGSGYLDKPKKNPLEYFGEKVKACKEYSLVLCSLLKSSIGRKAILSEGQRGNSYLLKALSAMRDTPSMVQKLLEEEREAVKSALQAVDEHMQLKKKEVEEVHRKLMKDEPLKDHIRSTFQMDLSKSNRSNRATSGYAPSYNPPVKIQQKPIFLEAIYEEDNDSGNLSFSSNRNEKRPERIRHSAIPRNTTAKSRCSLKDKVSSARPRGSELSVLPPIDMGWSNIPSDGCYTGPLNYRWQRVADNYIDSDLRVRSRRRCRSRALDTKLRLGYQEDDETEDECNGLVEIEMRLPRKRQITFGPPHSTSYSRWFSHFNSLDSHYN